MAGTCVSNGRCMPQMEGLEITAIDPAVLCPQVHKTVTYIVIVKKNIMETDRSKCMHECNDNFHPYLRVPL